MPFSTNNDHESKHTPRHVRSTCRGTQSPTGFDPSVSGYVNAPTRNSGRPIVGEDPLMPDGAPQPIGVDPAKTGSFRKLSADEGAVLTNRDNAENAAKAARTQLREADKTGSFRLQGKNRPHVEHETQHYKKNCKLFIGIGIAAVAIVVLIVVAMNSFFDAAQQANQGDNNQVREQEQVQANDVISYRDQNYGLVQDGDTWSLARLDDSGNVQAKLVDLNGTPVSFVHYNGAFIIPENLSGGTWDVLSYVPADGSVPSPVADADGNPVSGNGTIQSASLNGSTLSVQTDSGETDVDLG